MPTIPSKQTVVQIEIHFIGANLLYFEIKIIQIIIIQLVASRQQRVLLIIGIHIGKIIAVFVYLPVGNIVKDLN